MGSTWTRILAGCVIGLLVFSWRVGQSQDHAPPPSKSPFHDALQSSGLSFVRPAQFASTAEVQPGSETQPPADQNVQPEVFAEFELLVVPDYYRADEPLPPSASFLAPGMGAHQHIPTGGTPAVHQLDHWKAGYDHGFVIAPIDPDLTPFEIKFNGTFQFRYTNFSRSDPTWTDNSGQVNDIFNRNDIQVTRGLFLVSGYAYDPNLTYRIWAGGSTNVQPDFFFLPDVGYKFSEALDLHVGMGRIPWGSEFIIADFTTQLVDRSMATTFFQPDFALGLWGVGYLTEKLHYWAMLGNGLGSYALPYTQLDTNFVLGTALYYDAIGDYGKFISDLEYHEDPALRLVTSGLIAPESGQPNGQPFAESTGVRLSDGTPVVQPGAVAPGVTVNHFDQYGFAQAAQFKYRGLSLYGEGLFQWLQDLRGIGGAIPAQNRNIYASGYTAQAGYFVVPKELEIAGRTSQVYGDFGRHAEEYSVGGTYYIKGNPIHKISVDLQRLIRSPAQQVFTGYVAGQTGWMFRAQYEIGF